MRAFTPEISWHNRLPALSLDVSPHLDQPGHYRVATGGNDCRVYIWAISTSEDSTKPDIRIRAGLRRHQKSIGAVRFSRNHMLASGDDDGYIYLWKHKPEDDQQETQSFLNDDGFEDLEVWKQQRVLRGHIEDICDLAWSKDDQFLLSGSVDNSAILWDTIKGTKVWCSDLIKGYVQGVAMDPHSEFMAALSSDRTLRIYSFTDKRLVKAIRRINIRNTHRAFFCDDTVQTFCRRFDFSPDGQFLLAPTSRLIEKNKKAEEQLEKTEQKQDQNDSNNTNNRDASEKQMQPPEVKKKPLNALLVFKRSNFSKPVHYYPTGTEVALCVRFSPVVYKLRNKETNFWDVPYRIVFAVATSRSILIYDSQQSTPIGYASQIHLARITDLAWSSDGSLLMITSYDGYSTLITFEKNEFGEVYTEPLIDPTKAKTEEVSAESSNANGSVLSEVEVIPKKGQKRFKTPRDTQTSKKEKLIDESCSDDEEKSKVKAVSTPPKRITPTLFKYFSRRV